MSIECVEYDINHKPSPNSPITKFASLDPNHSNFLLIDDARLNVFGGEIDSRSRIEKALFCCNGEQREAIPLVIVCIEGGPNTVWQVLESVKNGIPCLFVNVI